jgi:hypothetical protein
MGLLGDNHMFTKITILSVLFFLFPYTVFSDCTEQCYDSKCEVPGACEMKCENNICYYYDEDGNCWKYDKDRGYYPCGCECYKCDDSCFDDDDHHHHDDCDDWDEDDYCCFIHVIQYENGY